MEKYVIFVPSRLPGDLDVIKYFTKRLETQLGAIGTSVTTTGQCDIDKFFTTTKIHVSVVQSADNSGSASWKTFEVVENLQDHLIDFFATLNELVYDSQVQVDLELLSQKLHRLADQLPLPGMYLLDVVWFWQDDDSYRVQDELEYFGALKRCTSWHNSRLFIIGQTDQESMVDWIQLLRGSVVLPSKNLSEASPLKMAKIMPSSATVREVPLNNVWHGCVEVPRNLESFGFERCSPLHSFSLSRSATGVPTYRNEEDEEKFSNVVMQRISFSTRLEVVTYCKLETVPPYVVNSSEKFHLLVTSECDDAKYSSNWLQTLTQKEELGAILRLNYATDGLINYCYADWKPTTENWKKSILEGRFESVVPPLHEDSAQILFLVVGQNDSPNSSGVAYLLHDPSELNGFAAHRVVLDSKMEATKPDDPTCRDHLHFLKSLPDISQVNRVVDLITQEINASESLLGKMVTDVEQIETSVLVRKFLLSEVRAGKYQKAFCSWATDFFNAKENLLPEYLVDSNDWPERMSLLNREVLAEKRKRLKSSERLSSLFPSQDSSCHLTCSDFLKCFDKTGGPKPTQTRTADKCSSKNRLPQCMRPNVSLESAESMKWPEAKECHFPDVYYNLDEENMEAVENDMTEMQNKCVKRETMSTFLHWQESELMHRITKATEKSDDLNRAEPPSSVPNIPKRPTKQNSSSANLSRRTGSGSKEKQTNSENRNCLAGPDSKCKKTLERSSSTSSYTSLRSPSATKCLSQQDKSSKAAVTSKRGCTATPVRQSPRRSPRRIASQQESGIVAPPADCLMSPKRTPRRDNSDSSNTPRRSPRLNNVATSLSSSTTVATPLSSSTSTSATPSKPRLKSWNDELRTGKATTSDKRNTRAVSVPNKSKLSSKATSASGPGGGLSEVHIKKLRVAVVESLEANGIDTKHKLYSACGTRLLKICKAFVKDLIGLGRTSEQMRKLANDHVKQVINFEKDKYEKQRRS